MDTDTKSALTRNKILGEYAYQKDLTWKIKVKQLSYIRMHRTGCDSILEILSFRILTYI